MQPSAPRNNIIPAHQHERQTLIIIDFPNIDTRTPCCDNPVFCSHTPLHGIVITDSPNQQMHWCHSVLWLGLTYILGRAESERRWGCQ